MWGPGWKGSSPPCGAGRSGAERSGERGWRDARSRAPPQRLHSRPSRVHIPASSHSTSGCCFSAQACVSLSPILKLSGLFLRNTPLVTTPRQTCRVIMTTLFLMYLENLPFSCSTRVSRVFNTGQQGAVYPLTCTLMAFFQNKCFHSVPLF